MKHAIRIASIVVTLLCVSVAIGIGGGVPLTPEQIADATIRAARNVTIAEDHTHAAATDTESMSTIARNVEAQLATSRRMLGIQLRIERASRDAGTNARELNAALAEIGSALSRVRADLEELSSLSDASAGSVSATTDAASDLQQVISLLQARFVEVTAQSRELNRKARGFAEIKDGPND